MKKTERAAAAIPFSRTCVHEAHEQFLQQKCQLLVHNKGAGASKIPFHHLPLEKRCEIKFQSGELLKSAVFAGKILYSVLCIGEYRI